MEITETLYVKTREEWRSWLEKNHNSQKEIWLIYYKKHTGQQRIPYDDAVEEALCFGWIDSTVKRIDEKVFVQRFTPRKKRSNWSDLNIERAAKMIVERKMTDAGMNVFDVKLIEKRQIEIPAKNVKDLTIPSYIKDAFSQEPDAWSYFLSLAPSYRKNYIVWIDGAKRDETRFRRINEALSYLREGKKLPMK